MSDLISKRFIQDALIEKISNLNAEGATQTARELIRLKKFVDGLTPSASAEAIHGEWIEVEVFPEVYDIEGVKTWGSEMQCDQCGFRHTAIEGHMAQYNFCPHCGAKMDGERSE